MELYCIHVSQRAFGIESRSSDSGDEMSVNSLAILKFRASWQSFLTLLPFASGSNDEDKEKVVETIN